MRTVLKHIAGKTYKPLLEKYLSSSRKYKYEDILLEISPDVFHPGYFFSTKFLLKYLRQLPLQEKHFLELGCGSGLIAIYVAKKGAVVTATDINPHALRQLHLNALRNDTTLTITRSDLFTDIPVQQFDIIAINPPYYKKDPENWKDYAWHCGRNGEFFEGLFLQLGNYVHRTTEVCMVLFDGCDFAMIRDFAAANSFELECVATQQTILEKTFIYKVKPA